jgi:hypothetical protein
MKADQFWDIGKKDVRPQQIINITDAGYLGTGRFWLVSKRYVIISNYIDSVFLVA